MAIVQVQLPGYEREHESTFDKIMKGLQVAGQLAGVGVEFGNLYNNMQKTKISKEANDLEKSKTALAIEKSTSLVPAEQAVDPATNQLKPGVFKFNFQGQDQFRKYNETIDPSIATHLFPVTSPIDEKTAVELKSQGKPVYPIGTNLYIAPDEKKSALIYDEKRAEIELKKAQADALKQKTTAAPKAAGLTPGETATDKAFAKDYNDFIAAGGYADVQKNLNQLRDAKDILSKSDTVSGPILGVLPKGLRDIVTPQGASVQDAVEEVVQRNLRLILGAQFTQKEGELLLARAFNPRQSEAENMRRLDRLMTQIGEAAKAKEEAAKYFEQNGTLKGYQGRIIRSIDDIAPMEQTQKQTVSKPVGLTPAEQEELKMLEKKYGGK